MANFMLFLLYENTKFEKIIEYQISDFDPILFDLLKQNLTSQKLIIYKYQSKFLISNVKSCCVDMYMCEVLIPE